MRTRTRKRDSFFALLLIVVILLTSRYITISLLDSVHPNRLSDIVNKYGNSKWESEDGKVVMYVDKEILERSKNVLGAVECAFGTVKLNDESVPVYFRFTWKNLAILPIIFFDGKEFEPVWDGARKLSTIEGWYTKYTQGSKQIKIISNEINIKYDFALPDEWTLHLVEKNLPKDKIAYPEICLPEYYNLYLEYEDLFAKKMTYQEVVTKYGVCDEYLPHDYDPNSNTLPRKGKYYAQSKDFGEPIYYVSFEVFDDGTVGFKRLWKAKDFE